VVCTVYEPAEHPQRADCQVVFLDERNRAINRDVRWSGAYWEFIVGGDLGGYADRYDWLQPYVQILQASTTPKVQPKRPTRAAKKQQKAKKAATKRKRMRPHVPKISETPAAPPSTNHVPWTEPTEPPESGTPT